MSTVSSVSSGTSSASVVGRVDNGILVAGVVAPVDCTNISAHINTVSAYASITLP